MAQTEGSHELLRRPLARAAPEDLLSAENDSLRLLLSQARLDAWDLYSQSNADAKASADADQLHKLIVGELHHRIKNMLATVLAIVSQSLRGVTEAEHARQAIEGRLMALGKAHDLLLQERWSNADLGQIVRGAIMPFDNPQASRIAIEGPDLRMASGAVIAIAIAMTLNELCTNAMKYGALSAADGRVEITWTLDPATQAMQLSWCERNGPPARVPDHQGFGTRLIEMLGKQLNGKVALSYETAGFAYRLDAPLASLMATPQD
ncbi:signal transduction histidine kinase [Rhodopseudomonas palustris HaA2]|uniref:histidine kinase n=1 Tax=Rhodopseudomonas palustris (strain HaA2) TaxID=316058 RepID=Q2IY44_RHOP2|nr:HWE histidine kinase domain-containing protein [Rhodopseudomonas palustris]ABD06866.1 signal transduction histidine kinase [Rhodopseudomonas palustris HaA2]